MNKVRWVVETYGEKGARILMNMNASFIEPMSLCFLWYKSKNNVIDSIYIRMYKAHNQLIFVRIYSIEVVQLFHSLLLNLLPLHGVKKIN